MNIELVVAILTAAGILFSALFGYKAGKNKEAAVRQEEMLEVIEDVRKAKSRVNDPRYVKRLLRKYGK